MAATAYAALRSLLTTIAMEQTRSPLHPPFAFPAGLIDALVGRVQFMIDFLERGWKGAEHLEPRITHLAYAAEDAIEIPIVDLIRSGSATNCNNKGYDPHHLERITGELGCIMAEMLMLIEDKSTGMAQDVHSGGSKSSTTSSTAPPQLGKTKMVGFEENKSKIIGELTRHDHQPGLQIIPIVGMGGIGKTTLARNVFHDNNIMKHFDVRAWVTVSQEYNVNNILKGILSSIPNQGSTEISRDQVHKSLFNRRYLVVFDDMWSTDIWDEIKQYFPDNNNGSRIMVTTRLTNLAAELSTSFRLGMKGLDAINSWNLFCDKVFGQRSCPLELQAVGKEIVRNCGGLPLAITVIGGLLAKSSQTLKYWEHVVEDFHSCLYSSDDDHCSKILLLSYNHLPIHLKPCLLYLGVFPEDHVICVSKLMRLWIAEGFLKPLGGKALEEIAEDCLKDLIDRNFIIVSHSGSRGKIRYCIIHDLLRELCLREAQKEMFYCVVTQKWFGDPLSMGYQRRIVIKEYEENITQYSHLCDFLGSISHVRSLILAMPYKKVVDMSFPTGFSPFMLLRIFFSLYSSEIFGTHKFLPSLVNTRYLVIRATSEIYSSINLFRNFQVIDDGKDIVTPIQIWNLVQLHRVHLPSIILPEPLYCLEDQHNNVVLEQLQSLSTLEDFRFSEETIKRIPNVKKLKVGYWTEACEEWYNYGTLNLDYLKKLESFSCSFDEFSPNREEFLQGLAFPPSLKKLSLRRCKLIWEDMTVLGKLPHLEILHLDKDSFVGPEWNPIEGEFRCLKILKMSRIIDLMDWNADSTHFPRLEQLRLFFCFKLKEIPLALGDISALRLIEVDRCSVSATLSAKNILEEQQSLGNEDLVVKVYTDYKYRSLHDLEIKKFAAGSGFGWYADMDNEESELSENDKTVHYLGMYKDSSGADICLDLKDFLDDSI